LPPPLLSSFEESSLTAARAAAPEFARALLLGEQVADWRRRADAVGAEAINVDGHKLGALWAHDIKRAGFALGAYTINDAVEARALVAMGVDYLFSDAPDIILQALLT
jgi:glycerophosphoryl diester phosphodiesterase